MSQKVSPDKDITTALLATSGLQSVLQKYGHIKILSFITPSRKNPGSLDIQVDCASCKGEEFQKIFNEIGRTTSFNSFYSGEKDSKDLKNRHSDVRHVGMSKILNGNEWEVNIWLVSSEQPLGGAASIDIKPHKKSTLNLSSSLTSNGGSKIKPLGLIALTIYIAILIGVFLGMLAILNKVFNDRWGLQALSSELVSPSPDATPPTESSSPEAPTAQEATSSVESPQATSTDPISIDSTTEDHPSTSSTSTESPELTQNATDTTSTCEFNFNIRLGQSGEDVANLQRFLSKQDIDIYPEGIISGYFGNLTKAAVIRFQERYVIEILDPWEISQGTGFVGRTTRAKINELCGVSNST